MPSAPLAALIISLTLAGVLLLSGLAKLRDKQATRDAFTALRVPGAIPADLTATALPWVEIVAAVLLPLAPSGWLVPVAVVVLILMLAYTWVIGRALGFKDPVTCSCFGSIGRHDVDRTTLARNLVLTLLAGLFVWLALAGGSVPGVIGQLDAADWWALAATLGAVAVAVLVIGVAGEKEASYDEDDLDYQRTAIPYGVVTRLDGSSQTIAELAWQRAQLLVIVSPGCSPCVRVIEKVSDWAERLAPGVGVLTIYPDEATANNATHAPELTAWEPEANIRRLFSVGTPAAVLLGGDGLLAGGPVVGENKVERFISEVEEALVEMTEQAEKEQQALIERLDQERAELAAQAEQAEQAAQAE